MFKSELKLYNSLTRTKELFVPKGRQVTWYNCGPTVYDASHIGHARLYVSVDVMRRILEEYFGYTVNFVMNITDIDDKIIIKARQEHLFNEFKSNLNTNFYDKLKMFHERYSKRQDADVEKQKLRQKTAQKVFDLIQKEEGNIEAMERVCIEAKDVLASELDKELGSQITQHSIFHQVAEYWEKEFLFDMKTLRVREPDVMTRVSEYIPEIINFVENIIKNGYAYCTSDGVYFDTLKFQTTHTYAKLEPWSAKSASLSIDGEGDLSKTSSKRNVADFALWKNSKLGEPFWSSPWGMGRPGWHIECSAMATAVFGKEIDIHSGGIDLAFPHHDNEIAQSEACFESQHWVKYFVHVGHLHINNQKMSKSLKNFTSIRELMQRMSPETLRMLCVMQHWQGTMDFKETNLMHVHSAEETLKNFFQNTSALIKESNSHQFKEKEREFLDFITTAEDKVHAALCDNLNTPLAMEVILDLVSKTNKYISKSNPNRNLLQKSSNFICRILRIFGLSDGEYGFKKVQQDVGPYLNVISNFRDEVRKTALKKEDISQEILLICDKLRDVTLPNLGVKLDDRGSKKALVKISEKKEDLSILMELYKGRISPLDMFRNEYSVDEFGMPIDISKTKLKKLSKQMEKQKQLHEEYLKMKDKVDWTPLREKFKQQKIVFEE